ncbi:MAG TPA: hypothetical protein VN643_20155 [Pyrinomonadaceae bacterium]|nr:hypothetical protein [Pyrinomonadaceae bacterium]
MLNIHNGDSTAGTARNAPIPGAHLAFREALVAGPTPANLEKGEWRKLRAAHLSSAYGGSWEEAQRDLERLEAALASSHLHDEVVLWFEHDLFCQINLLYLLDWFAARDVGKTKLSLIFIGEFPGRPDFRGLGELEPMELASLFDSRHEITEAEMQLATAAWKAYCSPDPTALEEFLKRDTAAMPFLKPALLSHLARFPSVRNGLGRVEECSLTIVNEGHKRFGDLFRCFIDKAGVYGFGDSQVYLSLQQLSNVRAPLLRNGGSSLGKGALDHERVKGAAYEITDRGRAVLKGDADFVKLNGIDIWLGGVHLTNDHLWRWDDDANKLVRNGSLT